VQGCTGVQAVRACRLSSSLIWAVRPVALAAASLPARGRPPQAAARRAGLEKLWRNLLRASILAANRTVFAQTSAQGNVAQ
jgi:hypothetical protein